MEFFKKILRDLYFLYDINISYRNLFQTGGFQQEMKISCQISISHAWIFFKSYQNLNSYLVFLFYCEILNILQESFFFHWKNDFLVETHSLKGIFFRNLQTYHFGTGIINRHSVQSTSDIEKKQSEIIKQKDNLYDQWLNLP